LKKVKKKKSNLAKSHNFRSPKSKIKGRQRRRALYKAWIILVTIFQKLFISVSQIKFSQKSETCSLYLVIISARQHFDWGGPGPLSWFSYNFLVES